MSTIPAEAAEREVALRFDGTVDRRLVHKAAIEQVLLCDHRKVGEGAYACASQPPRAHRYYSDTTTGRYDPLLILEVARQAGVVVAHEYLGVPQGAQFVFSDLTLEVTDVDALRSGPEPARVVAHLRLHQLRHRRGELTGGDLSAELELDGVPVATVTGGAVYLARAKYAALRKLMGAAPHDPDPPAPPPPLAPEAVGRRDATNVVIAEPSGTAAAGSTLVAEVLVDDGNPTFFDHPLDHVPGGLLIEALRQAAIVAASRAHDLPPAAGVAVRCHVDYGRFAELGAPVRCEAVAGEASPGDGAVTVPVDLALVQLDEVISRAHVSISFLTDRP